MNFEEKHTEFKYGNAIEEWKPLSRLCGHLTPEPIRSQSNIVRATFRTDEKDNGDGFRVDYMRSCGGLFQGASGTINSPHYGLNQNYENDLVCIFTIQRSSNEYIRIEFDDFDLESHPSCVFDKVEIYLGDHTNASVPKYGPYCGNVKPPTISSQELITIIFKSDPYVSKRGFSLKFNVTTCGGVFKEDFGMIISPEFMQSEGELCNWKIELANNKSSIIVRVLEMDLQNDYCRYDCCNYVSIYDGSESYSLTENMLANFCDNNHENVLLKSKSNHMLIKFYRGYNGKDKYPRFKLSYEAAPGPEMGCGGTIQNQVKGVITSPDLDGDSDYESNLNCVWTIAAPDTYDQILSLTFERFDVEGSEGEECENDYLAVYDGTTLHSQSLAKLCGRIMIPDRIISTTSTVLLQFISNANVTGHGFRLHFEALNRTCGGMLILTESKKELSSPNYPNDYPVPEQCSWDMRSPNSFSFYRMPTVINIVDLDLNCSRGDFLQILQSSFNYMEMVQYPPITLCSSSTNVRILSNRKVTLVLKTSNVPVVGDVAYDNLKFMSNSSSQAKSTYRGFKLTYHTSLCNETIDGPESGFVMSHQYPKTHFVHDTESCLITIRVAETRQISVYFSQFQFYQCHYSNMTIYEGNSTLARATLCDMQSPPDPFFSKSNSITIAIRTSRMPLKKATQPHSTNNKISYFLSYASNFMHQGPPGCGGNLTSFIGSFTSPNYPLPYQGSSVCTWTITTNGYHTVSLSFDYFSLPSYHCDKIFVAIFDGTEDIAENQITRFCGQVSGRAEMSAFI